MTEETLRELLTRVHERLSASSSIDAEARELLATVMRDIDGALARGSPAGGAGKTVTGRAPAADSPVATAPRLEALAVRFEAEHPAIAQLLRQIGELLGQAGI